MEQAKNEREQTCQTCKFRFTRNAVIPRRGGRDIRPVCSYGVKHPNRGYVKTCTRKNEWTHRLEWLPACEHYEEAKP